jgi:Flp pilus assembly protein TadD
MARQFTIDQTAGFGPAARGAFVAGVIALAVMLKACGGDTPRVQDIPQEQGMVPAEAAPAPTTVATTTEVAPAGPVTFEAAETAFHERRFTEATTLFTAYTGQKPENGWGWYMLGLSQWKSGQLDDAVASFGKSLEKDSSHVKTLTNLARVLLDLDRPADALTHGQRVVQLDSTSAEGWRIVGRAYTELDSVSPAIIAYQRSIALDEQDVWSMNNLGMIYLEAGQYQEALGPLARAAELSPERAVFQNNLGMALERAGQPTAAQTAYRAAIAADTSYAKAVTNLARVEQHKEADGVEIVDLAVVSREFQDAIARWKQGSGDVGVVR